MSVLARLEEIARRRPAAPALRSEQRHFTYAELLAAADRRSDELAKSAGIVPLDGADPLRFLVDFLGARRAGLWAISHPPSTPQALSRLRETAMAASPRVRGPGATVFYSSGSVGPSKAVPLSDENLCAAALAFDSWGEVGPEDRLAVGLSPAQVFAFVRGALNALLVGAEAVFYVPRRDPLAEAESLGATAVLLPTAFLNLAARHTSRVALSALRCGGGALHAADANLIETRRGVPVRAGYGLTESSGLASRQRGDRSRRPGSSGTIAPGMEVAIVREDGRPCRAGQSGEIRLRGAAVFDGYLLPEDPTRFDEEGRLRTGDVGYLDEEQELVVRGRLAFSLYSGDRVLCAEEVEAAIAEHPAVEAAAAVPLARAFAALVVLRESSDAVVEQVLAHAARRLPAFARPRRVVAVAELPLTPAGKIDRRAASQWLSEQRETS